MTSNKCCHRRENSRRKTGYLMVLIKQSSMSSIPCRNQSNRKSISIRTSRCLSQMLRLSVRRQCKSFSVFGSEFPAIIQTQSCGCIEYVYGFHYWSLHIHRSFCVPYQRLKVCLERGISSKQEQKGLVTGILRLTCLR